MKIISKKEARELGLKRYFTGKPCVNGGVGERLVIGGRCNCRKCKDKVNAAHSRYRKSHKDKVSKYQYEYRSVNKDKACEYRKTNKDKISLLVDNYRAVNKEKLIEQRAEYYRNNKEKYVKYRKNNPIPYFIRASLRRIITNWKGGRGRMEEAHGYTFEQLSSHIESQFKDGMSWENRSDWHIDHIKPIKAFLDEGITDPKIINSLENLQPLWAHENLSKGAKWQ